MRGIKRVRTFVAFGLMNLPMSGRMRAALAKIGGVNFVGKDHFVGRGVCFDTMYPELITIGNHVHITGGCVLLSHYLDTDLPGVHWKSGRISIGEDTFVGMNSIISKPCSIGCGVIIGAGSVITKDIPDYQIWAGNPAHYIKDSAR